MDDGRYITLAFGIAIGFCLRGVLSCLRDKYKDKTRTRNRFQLVILCALSLLSGCANIIVRTDCDAWATKPYQCTCEVAEAIATPFSRPSGPEGGIAQAVCTVILPISIISLPCDAVLDTLMLPWDLYNMDDGCGANADSKKQTEEVR